MPKYKLLPATKSSSATGPDLYIVVAQEDFVATDGTFIPCGTEGGFVESEENLPNTKKDRSWIFATNGYVVGNAKISNSVIRFGYVSGNASVTNSVIDKKSNIMENASVENSTIFDSIVGVSSQLNNCMLDGGCCINLYDGMSLVDSKMKDTSISGNISTIDCLVTNCALHNSDCAPVVYKSEKLTDYTKIDVIEHNYRDKHGTKEYAHRNWKYGEELRRAKACGELRAGYDINSTEPSRQKP